MLPAYCFYYVFHNRLRDVNSYASNHDFWDYLSLKTKCCPALDLWLQDHSISFSTFPKEQARIESNDMGVPEDRHAR